MRMAHGVRPVTGFLEASLVASLQELGAINFVHAFRAIASRLTVASQAAVMDTGLDWLFALLAEDPPRQPGAGSETVGSPRITSVCRSIATSWR